MNLNFDITTGLIPVIIQDFQTLQVLMLGYMNQEAVAKTIAENRVTFFSRSKNRLWTKGETSGNYLEVIFMYDDCDKDTLLILAKPSGLTCHNGTISCFNTSKESTFLYQLENTLQQRISSNDENSYTVSLIQKGINKVAQKVGEEAVELVIEAKDNNDTLFLNEAADLMYHYLLLLQVKGFQFKDVEAILKERNKG